MRSSPDDAVISAAAETPSAAGRLSKIDEAVLEMGETELQFGSDDAGHVVAMPGRLNAVIRPPSARQSRHNGRSDMSARPSSTNASSRAAGTRR